MANEPAFSVRTRWNLEENDLSLAVRSARSKANVIIDLTVSNPTACGFDYGDKLILKEAFTQRYDPQPLGLLVARNAVAHYYAERGAHIEPDQICLTTSTSEAYSFLFRLLCDPGDEVLVARPSYPLLTYLADLDDVVLREYSLHYDPNADEGSGWNIDFGALEGVIGPRCRAIVLVHPNNPTGNYASANERQMLEEICLRHGLALIVDEVFLDYALSVEVPKSFAVGGCRCLCFVLSGISKVCALPQMKLSWIASTGPPNKVTEAMSRLEVVADTFLSLNTPVQFALPKWLGTCGAIQGQILARMRSNLAVLEAAIAGTQAQRLSMQGGWSAVLRVPRSVNGFAFAEAALKNGALVQPGEWYGLPEGRAVVSLLTRPEEWKRGIALLPIR